MIQVVFEARRHYSFVRLLCQYDCVLIVAIKFDLFDFLDLVVCLELVGSIHNLNIGLLFLSLIKAFLMVILWSSNERIDLVEVLLLVQ